MCGRYRYRNVQQISQLLLSTFGIEMRPAVPRFNVSPSQMVPAVMLNADGVPAVSEMRWGFVPFWDKSEKPKMAPINARVEEAPGKKMFAQAIRKRRCLLPADGFYEWRRDTPALKQPFDIHLKGERPFFLAGIYEEANETRPDNFLVFTTPPNALMAEIHDRMPVLLLGDDAKAWLRPGELDEPTFSSLIRPHEAADMEALPVSSLVNSPRNDVPEVLAPVAFVPKPPATQGELF